MPQELTERMQSTELLHGSAGLALYQVVIFKTKTLVTSPQLFFFLLLKVIFIGSKHPKTILSNVESKITATKPWTLWAAKLSVKANDFGVAENRVRHPQQIIFVKDKRIFSGSQYPETNSSKFESKIAALDYHVQCLHQTYPYHDLSVSRCTAKHKSLQHNKSSK